MSVVDQIAEIAEALRPQISAEGARMVREVTIVARVLARSGLFSAETIQRVLNDHIEREAAALRARLVAQCLAEVEHRHATPTLH